MLTITYLGHSGFSVRTPARLLVFDYIGKHPFEPSVSDDAITFASHAHSDHFDRRIVKWYEEGRTALVTGYDVTAPGVQMKPGDVARIGGVEVRAYGSTDQGVSFLVDADGARIFHAGDLNLWDWRYESTPQEIAEATVAFESVLDTLRGERIDVAFFPTDPRMGDGFETGALRFAEAIRPRVIIPMHWWGDESAAHALDNAALPSGVRARALTALGESLSID